MEESEDSDDDDDDLDALEAEAAAMDEQDEVVIATKKRRSGKGMASASTSDPMGLLEWWFRASKKMEAAVLKSMVAYTKGDVKKAAEAIVEHQAGSSSQVAHNEVIRDIASRAAVRSAEMMVPLVSRRADEVPAINVMKVRHCGFRAGAGTWNCSREEPRAQHVSAWVSDSPKDDSVSTAHCNRGGMVGGELQAEADS